MPESVRKYTRMIKEARTRLAQEKNNYQKSENAEYLERHEDFKRDMNHIPEEYINRNIKSHLLKARNT